MVCRRSCDKNDCRKGSIASLVTQLIIWKEKEKDLKEINRENVVRYFRQVRCVAWRESSLKLSRRRPRNPPTRMKHLQVPRLALVMASQW